MFEHAETLVEARDRLHEARSAFDAFLLMLSGAQAINQEGLYYLLQPVASNLEQAEKCLALLRH